jgi:hypothetical protein
MLKDSLSTRCTSAVSVPMNTVPGARPPDWPRKTCARHVAKGVSTRGARAHASRYAAATAASSEATSARERLQRGTALSRSADRRAMAACVRCAPGACSAAASLHRPSMHAAYLRGV